MYIPCLLHPQMLAFPMSRLPSPIPDGNRFMRQANRCHPLSTSHKPVLSPLCFHGLTNCFSRKPFALINICVGPRVSPPNCSRRSGIHGQNEPTLLSSYSYELFVVAKKTICIGISDFHTLSQKHPGWGRSMAGKQQIGGQPAQSASPHKRYG